jgi:hypothetical protein
VHPTFIHVTDLNLLSSGGGNDDVGEEGTHLTPVNAGSSTYMCLMGSFLSAPHSLIMSV